MAWGEIRIARRAMEEIDIMMDHKNIRLSGLFKSFREQLIESSIFELLDIIVSWLVLFTFPRIKDLFCFEIKKNIFVSCL